MKNNIKHRQQLRGPAICVVLLLITGILNLIDGNNYIAVVEFITSIAIVAYMFAEAKIRAKDMAEFMAIITGRGENMSSEIISRFPKPVLVLSVDGKIVWYNDMALSMFSSPDLYDISLPGLIPQLKWTEILKNTDVFEIKVEYNQHQYNLFGSILIRKDEQSNKELHSVIIYFDDIT